MVKNHLFRNFDIVRQMKNVNNKVLPWIVEVMKTYSWMETCIWVGERILMMSKTYVDQHGKHSIENVRCYNHSSNQSKRHNQVCFAKMKSNLCICDKQVRLWVDD